MPSPVTSGAWPASAGQEPGGDRVELADVAEGERAQERTQRRGRVRPVEDPAHPAVPQQRHVVDAVGAGDHPGDQRGHLQPGVGALVARDAQVLIGQRRQARRVRPARAPGPAPPPTPDSDRRSAPTSPRACERVASQRCPSGLVLIGPSQVPISQHGRASRRYGTLTRPSSSVDRGLDSRENSRSSRRPTTRGANRGSSGPPACRSHRRAGRTGSREGLSTARPAAWVSWW